MSFPRILGHEVAATVAQASGIRGGLPVGTDVAISPYTSCGECASCRRGRPNACQFNETLGVQRDGALTEFIAMSPEKLYPAKLTTKELCLIEPLTVGFHAVSRGRVTAGDTVAVLGCGGVGLGAKALRLRVPRGALGRSALMWTTKSWNLPASLGKGGAHAINSQRRSVHDRLVELTEGRGPDVVIEAVGSGRQHFERQLKRCLIYRQGRLHRLCQRTRWSYGDACSYSCKKELGHFSRITGMLSPKTSPR